MHLFVSSQFENGPAAPFPVAIEDSDFPVDFGDLPLVLGDPVAPAEAEALLLQADSLLGPTVLSAELQQLLDNVPPATCDFELTDDLERMLEQAPVITDAIITDTQSMDAMKVDFTPDPMMSGAVEFFLTAVDGSEQQQHSNWVPEGLDYIGTGHHLPNQVAALGVTVSPKGRKIVKHSKGRKQVPMKDLPVGNHANVLRCRQYRKAKSSREAMGSTELGRLEARNRQLRALEGSGRDRLERSKAAYLRLINGGYIKYY
jgi:hypothetical protein